MSYYRVFDTVTKFMTHTYWQDGFTTEELDAIIAAGEAKLPAPATVDNGRVDELVRRSNVSWLTQPDIPWLYDRMAFIASRLNGQYYGFRLEGFQEDFQYTVYHSEVKGYYDWHTDAGETMTNIRKLSMVLFLDNPDNYEGGDLQLKIGGDPILLDKTRGMVHVFPSFMLHRVTPVTAGLRRSLVLWLTGPSFV